LPRSLATRPDCLRPPPGRWAGYPGPAWAGAGWHPPHRTPDAADHPAFCPGGPGPGPGKPATGSGHRAAVRATGARLQRGCK